MAMISQMCLLVELWSVLLTGVNNFTLEMLHKCGLCVNVCLRSVIFSVVYVIDCVSVYDKQCAQNDTGKTHRKLTVYLMDILLLNSLMLVPVRC